MALILGGGAFRSWLGHEGGALIHGISALIKEALESILPLLHHERTQQKEKKEKNRERKRALTRYQILGPGSWTFLPLELWNKCLLFISHLVDKVSVLGVQILRKICNYLLYLTSTKDFGRDYLGLNLSSAIWELYKLFGPQCSHL